MKSSDRQRLRSWQSTILVWMLSAIVGWFTPSLPALANASHLPVEQSSESTGNERDDAGSLCVSQPAARRTEARLERSDRLPSAARMRDSAHPSAHFKSANIQFGEHLHRNGIGAPLRR